MEVLVAEQKAAVLAVKAAVAVEQSQRDRQLVICQVQLAARQAEAAETHRPQSKV